MPATTVHKFVTFMGIMSILHAAYSAAQHRSYLRITEQEFTTLPIDILIQGIVSLFMVMYGVMYIAGDFKEIRAVVDLENKSWETLRNLSSFQIFDHRGRSLSSVRAIKTAPAKHLKKLDALDTFHGEL